MKYFEDPSDKRIWQGISVFPGRSFPDPEDPGFLSSLAAARELANQAQTKTDLLLIGYQITLKARNLFSLGVDRIFIYDDPKLELFNPSHYLAVFKDYVDNYHPCAVMLPTSPMEAKFIHQAADLIQRPIMEHCQKITVLLNGDLTPENCQIYGNAHTPAEITELRPQLFSCEIDSTSPDRMAYPSLGELILCGTSEIL